ncbi:MAG: hypothetical protein V4598_07985 [Bdellovibrionota bacterium]
MKSLILSVFLLGTEVSLKTDQENRPSCQVVSFRLQEYAKRNFESDNLLEWFSLDRHSERQLKEIVNVINRMPYFLEERAAENLEVSYEWTVDEIIQGKVQTASKLKTEFTSSKHSWSDPFNGKFPEGVEVSFRPGIIRLTQRLSYEQYCLLDPVVTLKLETSEDSLVLTANNKKENL